MAATSLFSRIRSNDALHVAWCVSGIVGCLCLYGVLQERIMTTAYGEGKNAEHFKYSLFLVLCNRLMTCSVAIVSLLSSGMDLKPAAPLHCYAAVSASNVAATFCQYEALKFVTFPVQTLGKCAKMIPVMVWGWLINSKRYGVKDYGVAVAVMLGCTAFMLLGSEDSIKSPRSRETADGSVFGIALMAGYLAFDGFTSTFQDKLFKGYQMSIYNQILYVTLCSACISTFGLVSSGQLVAAAQFAARHPALLCDALLLSAAATVGQLFIMHTIKNFGALLFATVMTTRQLLSILLSCLLFSWHPLTPPQWAGTLVVFGALYYKSLAPKHKDAKQKQSPMHADAKQPQSLHVPIALPVSVPASHAGTVQQGQSGVDDDRAAAVPLLHTSPSRRLP